MRDELKARCARIEESYEFMLAFAAQGLRTEPGSGSGSQIRTTLGVCDTALTGLAELFTRIARADNLNASIHLRALLTDLFLIDEIVRPEAG
jgi:hypothetical protein